jgi:hypothetical protein
MWFIFSWGTTHISVLICIDIVIALGKQPQQALTQASASVIARAQIGFCVPQ